MHSSESAGTAPAVGVTPRPPRGMTWGPKLAVSVKKFQNVDTIHYGLFVQWRQEPHLFNSLAEGKNLAQQKDTEVPFHFGSCDANIHPTGRRGGFRWHLSMGDIDIFLSIRNPDGQTPNVWVEIGSISCWSYGFESVIAQVRQYIGDLHGMVIKSSVSRVDMAADYVGLPFSVTGIADHTRWVKRAVNASIRLAGSEFTGIDAGMGGTLALRVYDKSNELKARPAKREFFHARWGLKEDDETPVTRVEFQFRKDILREMGIKNLQSLQDKFNGLWQYATGNWFRFCKTPVDRENRHQDTAEIDPWWESVQGVEWSGGHASRQRIVPHGSADQLLRQAIGCIMKVAAIEKCGLPSHMQESLDRVCAEMHYNFSTFLERMTLNREDFLDRYHKKLSDVWAFKSHGLVGVT